GDAESVRRGLASTCAGGERDPGVSLGGELAKEYGNGLETQARGHGKSTNSSRGEGGGSLVGLLGDRTQKKPAGPTPGAGELAGLNFVEEAPPGADDAVRVVD